MTASDLPARQCPGGQSASTVDFNQESSHSHNNVYIVARHPKNGTVDGFS